MGHSTGAVAYRALTCPVRILPDFIVIGVHRGGTSAFYYHLTEHPSVAAATMKELNYFDRNFHKGPWWYRAHFPSRAQRRFTEIAHNRPLITGEASPYYLFHPLVPQRVAATLPHVKLIVLLRNPVARAYSQYSRYVHLGWETLPFEEAIAREAQSLDSDAGDILGHSSYLARGIYADQLQRWLPLFAREQFLILRSEDFYAAPAAVLKQALVFLDVPASGLPQKASYAHYDGYSARSEARTEAHGESGMTPAMRQRLQAYFAPHNARLYQLLGRDLDWD